MAELGRSGRLDHSKLMLGGVLALGIALRLVGLGSFPFQEDELYTILQATDLFDTRFGPGVAGRPLYFLLQHGLFAILPETPIALRLMPLLFGVAGIWATWLLGRRAIGTGTGLVAAFLVAVSPWHMHASGMARYWSLVYLLAALLCLAVLEAYRTERARGYLLALLLLLLGVATHPTYLFPVVGIALAVTVVDADGRFGWRWPSRTAWTHLWLPFLAALAVGYGALLLGGDGSALRSYHGRGWLATVRLVPAMIDWITPPVVTAAALCAISLLVWRGAIVSRRRWGMVATLGCASTVLAVLSASFVSDVYADHAMAMLPLVFVSAGALVQIGAEKMTSGSRWFSWMAATVLAAGVAPATASHLSDGTRCDYRPAFRQISDSEPDVAVLAWPIAIQRYYAGELDARELIPEVADLDRALTAEGDLWAVVSVRRYGIVGDQDGRIARWLWRHCQLVGVHERPRFDYRRYRVELHRCRLDAQ